MNGTDNTFDKEAWSQRKQEERRAVYDMADRAATAVAGGGAPLSAFLDVQARFDRYSATNALLIFAQMPQATQLKDFGGWKAEGVSIRRQQRGISILEPGKPHQREDGSTGTYYQVKKVFDISQTNAKAPPAPEVHRDDRLLVKALITNPPVPIQTVEHLPHNAQAHYDQEKQIIFVRKGMDTEDIFCSVSRELAHAELTRQNPEYNRGSKGFAAFCASHILCRKFGISVENHPIGMLPDVTLREDPQAIRRMLSEARDAAGTISARMVRTLERSTRPREQGR